MALEEGSARSFVGTMAREIQALASRAIHDVRFGLNIIGVERGDLDRLSQLADAYLDEGNVEIWVTKFGHKLIIIKAIRHILGLGLKEALMLVQQGCPFKMRSYHSLVDVERDERILQEAPGVAWERRNLL